MKMLTKYLNKVVWKVEKEKLKAIAISLRG